MKMYLLVLVAALSVVPAMLPAQESGTADERIEALFAAMTDYSFGREERTVVVPQCDSTFVVAYRYSAVAMTPGDNRAHHYAEADVWQNGGRLNADPIATELIPGGVDICALDADPAQVVAKVLSFIDPEHPCIICGEAAKCPRMSGTAECRLVSRACDYNGVRTKDAFEAAGLLINQIDVRSQDCTKFKIDQDGNVWLDGNDLVRDCDAPVFEETK